MFNLKNEFCLKIIFLFSFFALITAFFIQHILGHQPCNLCLIERIPYGLSMLLILIIFLFKKNREFYVLLLILNFIFALAISMYHFGIEQNFFMESIVCEVKNLSENVTKEDLIKQLNDVTVSCKDVTFKIFGLSLASINIVISSLFIITLIGIYNRYEKNK